MNEDQRQTISALSTLAAGLAGGVAGDSTANAVAGAQAGKNAVENNALGSMNSHPFEEKQEEHDREMGDRSIHLLTLNPGLEPKRDEQGNPITYAPGAFVPIRPTNLPTGYSSTSSGEIVGPKGGVYSNTGKSDSNGNTIYSNSGGFYVFDGNAKVSV